MRTPPAVCRRTASFTPSCPSSPYGLQAAYVDVADSIGGLQVGGYAEADLVGGLQVGAANVCFDLDVPWNAGF